MTILITGATGLVGNKLVSSLKKDNHTIHYLSTSKSKLKNNLNYKGFYWNPTTGEIDKKAFDDVTVIIHLAGASISKKWTKAYKKEILDSRVEGANLIFETLKSIPNKVERFISASAVGIYPSDLNYIYNENNTQIDDSFLGEVTEKWEKSASQFKTLSIDVSIVRIGVVLAKESGALVEMTKPINYGLGAVLASGQQYVSWIHIDDLVAIFKYILDTNLKGIYNAVSPYPITNEELTKLIAKTINKPLFLPNVPKFMLNLLLGEMHIILTSSQNVSCRKILDAGFQFHFGSLNKSLQNLLK
ncbi:TIGR01777 family oxidoreductase [Flavobacterium difficile]|uniref:TIGR01777 family protein n=1 Tax=Flavobacterium difficile TaxID=2709659 RepID=A0ABX0I5A2_9FLAO|nr:TIGR01777 family oxidoreductase [Flavobacterium difficile]NHM01303.1 TIGR01777 family protein [Flavobacterium difficile]